MRDKTEGRDRTTTNEIEGDVSDEKGSGTVPEAEIRVLLSATAGDGAATALFNPMRSAAYDEAGRLVSIGKRMERARRHVTHAEVLRSRGKASHAMGAMLAASTALLRAAVSPAVSMTEHRVKLCLLHVELATVGLDAWHDHVATLIDAALQAEIDMMVDERLPMSHLILADVTRGGVDVVHSGGSTAMAACTSSDLEAYDRLASISMTVGS